MLIALDALPEAAEQIEAAARLSEDPRLRAKIALARASLARAEGDAETAEARAREGLSQWTLLKDRSHLATATALVIEIALERGQVAEAAALTSSPSFAGAPLPLRAVVAARVAQLALTPDMALERAVTAADICRGEGSAKLEDEALQLAIVAAHRADRLPDALAIALRLADARQSAARRIQDVSRAARDAVKAVVAEASAVDRRTGAAADEARSRADRERQISALESVAHSARNTLAAISASGEMMAAEPPPVDRSVLLARLLDGVDRLGAQLERALDEARGRELPAEDTVTLLAPLAHRVADVFAAAASRKGIQLQVRVRDALTSSAPPDDVREILENLVSNAVKFCSSGDTVRVSVYRFGVLAVLEVSDDGPGIPESDQPRLFSRYGTLSPRPTGGEASSGLGLSQVQLLAESHGGAVTVRSAPGRGSCFQVTLPLG